MSNEFLAEMEERLDITAEAIGLLLMESDISSVQKLSMISIMKHCIFLQTIDETRSFLDDCIFAAKVPKGNA